MIAFRAMTDAEFPAYLDYFIPDYAEEIAANYRLSQHDSLARAKQEIAESLPEGVNTDGQVLLCMLSQEDHAEGPVGYLWYKPDTVMGTAFIYDFHIFDAFQGRGLGKKALRFFEQHLSALGFKEIRLRVAGDNMRARHLYTSSGFGVTGINMSKSVVGMNNKSSTE